MPEFISILRWIRDIVYPKAVELETTISNLPDQLTGGYSQNYINDLEIDIRSDISKKSEVVETIEDLATYSGAGSVIVKEDGLNYIYESSKWVCKEWKTVYSIAELEDLDVLIYSKAKLVLERRSGDFIYDMAQSAVNNGGTIFDGWVRQYSGNMKAEWFGAKFDGSDDATALSNAFNAGFRYENLNKIGNDFLAKVKTNQPTSNSIFNAVKGINILGDSITHGAFALNSFNHSWGRIFQKMANVDLQSKSYGVINFLSLGSGATATTDIHSVNFTGSWNASANGLKTLIGSALSNSAVNNEIQITIPSFQNNANLNYIQSPIGGTFELYINGVLYSTTNTSGTLDPYAFVGFPVTDNGKGYCFIQIKVTVGTCEISTIQYYKGATNLVNLFASSGRKLREVTDSTIELVCANSSTLVMALGHNDTYTTDLVSRIDKLILECNNNNIMLVIPDFRWNLGTTDTVRQELVRLHQNVPNSIYIPFPELFKNNGSTVDGTYTVTTLDLFTDASHPNQTGHKLIAETIAKSMSFSVTSKEEANSIHNYVMPLMLNTGTTVENVSIVSSVKWDKSNLTVNCTIRMTPSSAFPIGTHIIQSSWNSKYEVPLIRQIWQGVAYTRSDTGAIVSIASLNSAGEIKLHVLSSFITNQSFEFSASVY